MLDPVLMPRGSCTDNCIQTSKQLSLCDASVIFSYSHQTVSPISAGEGVCLWEQFSRVMSHGDWEPGSRAADAEWPRDAQLPGARVPLLTLTNETAAVPALLGLGSPHRSTRHAALSDVLTTSI
jgi:hypothetical protein